MMLGYTKSILFALLCAAAASAAQRDLDQFIERRITELQPTAADKRFDEIGWAKDIREAKRLAAQHNRPVFLFTHDGRMNLGRC